MVRYSMEVIKQIPLLKFENLLKRRIIKHSYFTFHQDMCLIILLQDLRLNWCLSIIFGKAHKEKENISHPPLTTNKIIIYKVAYVCVFPGAIRTP